MRFLALQGKIIKVENYIFPVAAIICLIAGHTLEAVFAMQFAVLMLSVK
jgi:hypothetical protein